MARLDGGQGGILERWEDQAADDRPVAIPRGGGQVDPALLNLGIPLAKRDASAARIRPLAAQLVGLDGGEEGLGFDLPAEVPRSFSTVGARYRACQVPASVLRTCAKRGTFRSRIS